MNRLKRIVLSLLGIVLFLGASDLLVSAAETSPAKPPSAQATLQKQPPAKPVTRETRMRATGIVKEINGDMLRIERTITAELMDFYLEKPLDKIGVGDKVTISYVKKDEKNIAKRVGKATALPKKKDVPTPAGSAPLRQPPSPAK